MRSDIAKFSLIHNWDQIPIGPQLGTGFLVRVQGEINQINLAEVNYKKRYEEDVFYKYILHCITRFGCQIIRKKVRSYLIYFVVTILFNITEWIKTVQRILSAGKLNGDNHLSSYSMCYNQESRYMWSINPLCSW